MFDLDILVLYSKLRYYTETRRVTNVVTRKYVIVLHGYANQPYKNKQLLKRYDPEGNAGFGDIQVTNDPRQALLFDSPSDALTLWKVTSKTRPVRPDGNPNRPLTAFTIEIISVRDLVEM